MRNLILTAPAVEYPAKADIFTGNALDFTKLGEGQLVILTTAGKDVVKSGAVGSKNEKYQLVLGQGSEKQPVILPFSPKHFDFSHMEYADGVQFAGTIDLSDPTVIGEYTLILAKHGVPFNMRNKWTVSTYIKDTTNATAATLAASLVAEINKLTEVTGVEATDNSDGTFDLSVVGSKDWTDWSVKFADNLADFVASTSFTHANPPQADDVMVEDMASKAAADAGYHDTYVEAGQLINVNYPIKLQEAGKKLDHFDIFTIRCTERSEVRTKEDLVHQVIQIAIPMSYDEDNDEWTSADLVDTLETIFGEIKALTD